MVKLVAFRSSSLPSQRSVAGETVPESAWALSTRSRIESCSLGRSAKSREPVTAGTGSGAPDTLSI